jgi:ParB family chromosome partitioning protein
MSNDVLIDAEFRTLIPPLAPEEFKALEESILAEGCRDAIVVWKEKGVVLDGHNRYDICVKHGIPYRTFEKPLVDRDEAILWIIDNQLGRRNLNPEQMSLLRGQRYNRTKRQDGGHGDQKSEYQTDTPNTAEVLASQYGVSAPTIKRDGQFAQAVDILEDFLPGITARVVHGESISKQAVIEAAREPETAAEKLNKPHVANNSGENEWYTPAIYIEAARRVMGSIDTDPASSDIANDTVKAKTYHTVEDNGLEQPWSGNVWMNPPYAQPLVAEFSEALSAKYESGEITQACILVNNATETVWFQRMMSLCSAICFIRGRVKFVDKAGLSTGAPLQGQAILYLGKNPQRFATEFAEMGKVLYA